MNDKEVAVNYSRLPDTSGMDLDYRCTGHDPLVSRRLLVHWIWMGITIGTSLTGAVRIFGRFGVDPRVLATAVGAGLLFAAVSAAATKRWKFAILGVAAALGIPVGSWVLHIAMSSKWVLLGCAAAAALAACWLVDSIVRHYFVWLSVNPRTRVQERRTAARDWKERWWGWKRGPGEFYNDYRFYALLPVLCTIPALWPSWRTALLALVLPLAFGLVAVRMSWGWGRARHTGLIARLAVDALESWFTYQLATPDAPGLFRSPSGTPERRRNLAITTMAFLTVTLVPALRYFPVAAPLIHPFMLAEAFGKASRFLDGTPTRAEERAREKLLFDAQNAKDGPRFKTYDEQQAWLAHDFARKRPEAYMVLFVIGFAGSDPRSAFALVVGILSSFFFTPLLIYATLLGAARTMLLQRYLDCEAPEAKSSERRNELPWASYTRRLQESSDPLEREHLWIGAHAKQDYPVLLHRPILEEHAYIVGDSGSGKTALGLTSLLTQLIRLGDAAVVVIDLKGDNALFQTIRHEARESRRTFRYFTNELHRSTHVFNPLQQANSARLSLNQVCETILEALNLNHGEGYGRSYYSRVARRWLAGVLRQSPEIGSFEELYLKTTNPANFIDEKERQDAFELIAVIESLASFQQLNLTPERGEQAYQAAEAAISMPRVLAAKEVVYFWLPAAVETASVREIAKLVLYSLVQAAYGQVQTGGKRQAYVAIDEFQRIASENFKLILQQARSMGIGAILANQTVNDLVTPDTDLRATIQSNTRLKLCFSASDLALQDEVMKASGETTAYLWSHSHGSAGESGYSWSDTKHERIEPRLNRNDVIMITDHPERAVFHVTRGSGYTQFMGWSLPVQVGYTMDRATHDARSRAAWPEVAPGTIVATQRALDPHEFNTVAERLAAAKILVDEVAAADPSVLVRHATPPQPVPVRATTRLERRALEQQQQLNSRQSPVAATAPPSPPPPVSPPPSPPRPAAPPLDWAERLRRLRNARQLRG